ncbi:hypothetical protein [Niallia oryzisoli]|uniref:hypothetical protein n=1 Tax=Niallia oryzisoli TaxID=1737571 RepID=UPI0037352FAB
MESKELSNMRLKQVAVTNGLILALIIILFTAINVFTVKFAHFFFVLGFLILFQSIFGFIKGDSTKSFIPIFEKVTIYEKQKMKNEWYKERKGGNVWRLILSGFMFFQSYMYRNLTEQIFEIDLIFLFIMVFFLLVFVNVSMIMRFRRIDRSASELDLKGYTKESNLIGGAIGILFALVVFIIAIIYIIS